MADPQSDAPLAGEVILTHHCSLISLYALKTMKVKTIPYECWMDDIAVS